MDRQMLLKRISVNPELCFGKPCIRGHRIWVSLVLDLLAGGMSIIEGTRTISQIQKDILACIALGGNVTGKRYVEISAAGALSFKSMKTWASRPHCITFPGYDIATVPHKNYAAQPLKSS
jgi:uncharacterized protein (DUF433 family)